MQRVKRVAVTGAAGQIAYSLIFRIASGELLGPKQPIILHLLEVPEALGSLQGVAMELEDCAFPLLQGVILGSDPFQVFRDVQLAFLIGSKPRGPGMERKELLNDNGKIFIVQGKALNDIADRACLTLVVGNPCNTNCWIAMKHAPDLGPHRFFSMTRLDQNRAVSMLARKAACSIADISNATVWGNHSSTQVPDFLNAKIAGVPAMEVIKDAAWFEKVFVPEVQKRGAAVIAARGKSSAASAASAALDAMRSLLEPTPTGVSFSMSLFSNGNPYGIRDNLYFSFPCRSQGDGRLEIVKGAVWNEFLKSKITATEQELIEEQALVQCLI